MIPAEPDFSSAGRAAGTGEISSQKHFQLFRLWPEQMSSKTSRRPIAEQEESLKPPSPTLKTVMKTIHPPRWRCIKKFARQAGKTGHFGLDDGQAKGEMEVMILGGGRLGGRKMLWWFGFSDLKQILWEGLNALRLPKWNYFEILDVVFLCESSTFVGNAFEGVQSASFCV